jgi:integrase/recombinase XerD
MTVLAPHVTAFFQERLALERGASVNTQDSSAYACKLLLDYANKRLKVAPSRLELERIDAGLVVGFLKDLETSRSNAARSRNVRLAAIKSFMHFMQYRVPSALEQIQSVLAIPMKKIDTRLVRHLSAPEIQVLLDAPKPDNWVGIRDRALDHRYCVPQVHWLRYASLIQRTCDPPKGNSLLANKNVKDLAS